MVGPSRDYLWILARDKILVPEVRQQILATALQLGLDTGRLICVEHICDDVSASPKTP